MSLLSHRNLFSESSSFAVTLPLNHFPFMDNGEGVFPLTENPLETERAAIGNDDLLLFYPHFSNLYYLLSLI